MKNKPVLAVCGKGGVGKTALSALLGRAMLKHGPGPVLLIDADPAGGLVSAIGENVAHGLAQVRDHLIRSARNADDATKDRIATQLDYMVMEALEEREGYALLAMGRNSRKGCFCPANTLLRQAIDLLVEPFASVLIDAEAGLEQISREVTRSVTAVLAVSDGSARSADTIAIIMDMVGPENVRVVVNRAMPWQDAVLPEGVPIAGSIPEDEELKRHDRQGVSLWNLADDNPAVLAAEDIARSIGLLPT
ncbi:MAG: ArsA-related P-loop ATPase [Desulfatibacillaceae bacterium]